MASDSHSSASSLVHPQQGTGSPTVPLQHGSGSVPGQAKLFTEEGRVREVVQQIQGRLVQAQQLKLAISQQQQSSTGVSTISTNPQIVQAEEMSKRLKEVVLKLQEAVQEYSLVAIQKRLSAIATGLSLKYDVQHSKQAEISSLFLMCDAFYIEVCCQDNGHVTSVKLVQANNQVDSEVLTQLACAGKFEQLEMHLRSLSNFYSQGVVAGCDPSSMYCILTSLESMLLSITKMSPQTNLGEVILSNPLGHVMPRSGGLPMKLIFFIHPYEVLQSPSRFCSLPSDLDYIQQVDGPDMGVSAILSLQASDQVYPLSIDPNLFDVSKATFFPMTPQNSVNISAKYILHMSSEFPVSGAIRKELYNMVYSTEHNHQLLKGPHINQLIAREAATSKGQDVCTSKSRVVCLPSQRHHYYMPIELRSCGLSCDQNFPSGDCGVMMSKITFLHPVHIFSIVTLLRKQLVYNTLITSVLGKNPKLVPPAALSELEVIFELFTQPSILKVTIVVDMQDEEKHLAIDFVIPDLRPTSPLVTVRVGQDGASLENQNLSKIIKRCMSIPVTLYAVLKCPQLLEGNAAFVFQKYQQSLHDFDSELSSRSEKSRGCRLKLGGGAAAKEQHGLMDVGDWRYGGNLKRKRTD